MKGLVVPVLGNPVVVDGDWDDDAAIKAVLDCEFADVLTVPETVDPVLAMYFDDDGKTKQLDVNPVATTLVATVLPAGDYIAGPALLAGTEPVSKTAVQINLLDIVRIGARLVRAERTALR